MHCGIISAARRRSAGAGIASKWRINVTATAGGGYSAIAELQMRATVGGPDQCSGGTASTSATDGVDTAAKGFDDNAATKWSSHNSTMPQWLEYDFASNVDVQQIALTPANLGDTPSAFSVQYWDGATWQTYWSEASYLVTSGANQLLFSKPNAALPGSTRWRLNITNTVGGSNFAQFAELEWRSTPSGSDLTSPASADGGNPFSTQNQSNSLSVYDNSAGTTWSASLHPSVGTPAIIGYRFATQVDIHEVAITCAGTGDVPKTFDVQYLDPATGTWTTSWSVADSGTWAFGETKVFTKP